MDNSPSVLLTNDDGIGTTGIEAIERALAESADVTVVAPAENQSGSSRADSRVFEVDHREEGYAVQGTPADCVQFGVGWLDTEFDVVVSGCNDGPNVGAHRLTRSGTVAGAIEGAFLGTPSVAVSVYDPPEGVREFYPADYDEAGRVAEFLTHRLAGSSWPFGYLNVNVPATAEEPRLRLTKPVSDYELSVRETEDDEYHVWDHFWDPLRPETDGTVTDPVGTDRRALLDEDISVTPLDTGQSGPDHAAVQSLVDQFHSEFQREY